MLVVEIGSLLKSYEELAAICFGTCICHAQNTGFVVSQFWIELIFKRLTKNRLTSCTCLGRISTLQTKIFDKPMKLEPIIVSILTKFYKILARFRYQISMHKYAKIAQISHHKYISFHFFFLNNVIDFLSDLRFLEISKRSDA